MLANRNMLVEYIRYEQGSPIGCVVGYMDEDDNVGIGVSLCSPRDNFSKYIAKEIAVGRAKKFIEDSGLYKWEPENLGSKEDLVDSYSMRMAHRVRRYFKQGRKDDLIEEMANSYQEYLDNLDRLEELSEVTVSEFSL